MLCLDAIWCSCLNLQIFIMVILMCEAKGSICSDEHYFSAIGYAWGWVYFVEKKIHPFMHNQWKLALTCMNTRLFCSLILGIFLSYSFLHRWISVPFGLCCILELIVYNFFFPFLPACINNQVNWLTGFVSCGGWSFVKIAFGN